MTRSALAIPRREAGFFPWALLIAVVCWAVLLLAWSMRFTLHPSDSIVLAPADVRLVELSPAPASPAPIKPAPKRPVPKPERTVKRSRDALPVVRHRKVVKTRPRPAPKPAVQPRPAAKVPSTAHPQVSTHQDVMGARAVYSPLPRIPDDLRAAAMDETAVVRLHIHADGTVAVELVRPTDNPGVNRIILDTLRTWMFYPALDKGRPVASVQQIRIRLSVGD